MKYSEVILTDDNFDTELEKLSEIVGIHFNNYDNFVEKLNNNFKRQTHPLGFEEWITYSIYPSIGSDCSQAYQKGKLAYQFGNGFIILDFEILL
jgi:hypothetical protein